MEGRRSPSQTAESLLGDEAADPSCPNPKTIQGLALALGSSGA